MAVIISPEMNLPVPVVGVEPGPDWANDVNSCLGAIDSHDHTPGSGVQLTPLSLNINTDLPMNDNNLITARTVRFFPQATAPVDPADLGCLTEIGVDLYYIDGSGNLIRLTQSGAPAGATGTITGLPSGTASASFSGTTFTFQSATATPASLAVGPTTIAQAVASGFGVTISASGSQAANYALTLPIALPTVPSSIVSDSSGNLSFVGTEAGSWTPGVVASTNLDSVTNISGFYSRVGNIVTGTIQADIDANTAAAASVSFSLPPSLTSTFVAATNAKGTGVNIFDKNVGIISADVPNAAIKFDFNAVVLTATGWAMNFQYIILP